MQSLVFIHLTVRVWKYLNSLSKSFNYSSHVLPVVSWSSVDWNGRAQIPRFYGTPERTFTFQYLAKHILDSILSRKDIRQYVV